MTERRGWMWTTTAVAAAAVLALAACNKAPTTASATDDAPNGAKADVAAAGGGIKGELSDTMLTASVKSALLADPAIKSLDVQVETLRGDVQLSGFVEDQRQIDLATAAAHGVNGVKGVDNRLSLKPATAGSTTTAAANTGTGTGTNSSTNSGTNVNAGSMASPNVGAMGDDADISSRVKTALLRDSIVKSFDISVVTLKGDVRLTGMVDQPSQVDQAVKVARGVDGVHSIHDELTVKKK